MHIRAQVHSSSVSRCASFVHDIIRLSFVAAVWLKTCLVHSAGSAVAMDCTSRPAAPVCTDLGPVRPDAHSSASMCRDLGPVRPDAQLDTTSSSYRILPTVQSTEPAGRAISDHAPRPSDVLRNTQLPLAHSSCNAFGAHYCVGSSHLRATASGESGDHGGPSSQSQISQGVDSPAEVAGNPHAPALPRRLTTNLKVVRSSRSPRTCRHHVGRKDDPRPRPAPVRYRRCTLIKCNRTAPLSRSMITAPSHRRGTHGSVLRPRCSPQDSLLLLPWSCRCRRL